MKKPFFVHSVVLRNFFLISVLLCLSISLLFYIIQIKALNNGSDILSSYDTSAYPSHIISVSFTQQPGRTDVVTMTLPYDMNGFNCGPTTGAKQIFNTSSSPIDTARVRMDLAAAATYINLPGSYTDTLTFVATAAF